MRVLTAVLLLCAACGGGTLYAGDNVIADLRGGTPYCGTARTGPTITSKTVTVTDRLGNPLYDSMITECDWTCGNIGPLHQAFVFIIFYTDAAGAWTKDPHADPDRAICPTD